MLIFPAVGVDIVKTERFSHWRNYSEQALSKLFTAYEIDRYTSHVKNGQLEKADQFLASRYAGKEAFYKAYCSMLEGVLVMEQIQVAPFLTIASSFAICGYNGKKLQIHVDWSAFMPEQLMPAGGLEVRASLSHEQCCSVAFVHIVRG
jgi:phosphopantetheine--protein transferase-like protein